MSERFQNVSTPVTIEQGCSPRECDVEWILRIVVLAPCVKGRVLIGGPTRRPECRWSAETVENHLVDGVREGWREVSDPAGSCWGVMGGLIFRSASLITAAAVAPGSSASRSRRNGSGWTTATSCGAQVSSGKSLRLVVTIAVALLAMAAARTWRSFASQLRPGSIHSKPWTHASGKASRIAPRRFATLSGGLPILAISVRSTSSKMRSDHRGSNSSSSARASNKLDKL